MKNFVYHKIVEHEENDWWYKGMRKILITYLALFYKHKRGKVLDVGCGTGFLMKLLENSWSIYGIDISPLAIKIARLRGLKNIQIASIERIPFPDNYFDVVFAVDVLEHAKNDLNSLKEIYRILKPGGILIMA